MTFVVFGVPLDELGSVPELRTVLTRFLDEERTHRIFTPNPEILLLARSNPRYADVLRTADLALPDGSGVAIVEAVKQRRRLRRWPGIDVAALLLRLAAERGATVAFVGGTKGVAERAALRWRASPGLKVIVAGDGVAFGQDGSASRPEDDDAVVDAVRSAAPTVILVGMGAPKQERWIAAHADAFPSARVMIGVGGSFDVWAGSTPRAPLALRKIGLEWLWRLALEPWRLLRVVRATVVFPVLALFDRAD